MSEEDKKRKKETEFMKVLKALVLELIYPPPYRGVDIDKYLESGGRWIKDNFGSKDNAEMAAA